MTASKDYKKPLYIRIGRSVDPVIHEKKIDFVFGKAIEMKRGDAATLFVTCVMLGTAMKVQELLKRQGIFISVYSMPTVKPIDEDCIRCAVNSGKPIYTLEEHCLLGGLGDAIGRVILDDALLIRDKRVHFKKFGVPDTFAQVTGTREYLNDLFGISAEKVAKKIAEDILGE